MITQLFHSETSKSSWDKISPYVIPPISAGTSVILTFPLLIKKSELQQGVSNSPIRFKEGIIKGFKASPTVSIIVGSQMLLESQCKNTFENSNPFLNAGLVGFISAPILIAFNGQTMKKGIWHSLSNMSK